MPFRNSTIPSRVLDKKQQHWWVFRGERDCRLCWKSEKGLAAQRWNKGNISGIKTEQGWKSTNPPTEGRVSEVFFLFVHVLYFLICPPVFIKGGSGNLFEKKRVRITTYPLACNTGFTENILNLCAIKIILYCFICFENLQASWNFVSLCLVF